MQIQNHRLIRSSGTPYDFRQTPSIGGVVKHEYLVMHFTAGRNAASSVDHLANPSAKASAHVVIGRDGSIVQLVDFQTVAWHAGRSKWMSRTGLNEYSLGIELDNPGKLVRRGNRWTSWFGSSYDESEIIVGNHKNDGPGEAPSGWLPFTHEQLEAAEQLAALLVSTYNLKDVIGHDDISPGRKNDPGPAFPMEVFRSRIIGRQNSRPDLYETTAALNIRIGPGLAFAVLPESPLPVGTFVEARRNGGLWWEVEVLDSARNPLDIEGWVSSRFLREAAAFPA